MEKAQILKTLGSFINGFRQHIADIRGIEDDPELRELLDQIRKDTDRWIQEIDKQ